MHRVGRSALSRYMETWMPHASISLHSPRLSPNKLVTSAEFIIRERTHSECPLTLKPISCGILYSHEKGQSASVQLLWTNY